MLDIAHLTCPLLKYVELRFEWQVEDNSRYLLYRCACTLYSTALLLPNLTYCYRRDSAEKEWVLTSAYTVYFISYKYLLQIFTTQVRNLVFKNVFSHICCFYSVLELRGNGMDTKATFEMRRHLLQICSLLGEPWDR